jgi:hypothetical protein
MSDQSRDYADPSFSTVQSVFIGPLSSPAAAVIARWVPLAKMKMKYTVLGVNVAGTGANGVNIYKNGGSIGTIICSASAAGYQGTFTPATGAGTATSAIYDTTDTLDFYSVGSETNMKIILRIDYQNQY